MLEPRRQKYKKRFRGRMQGKSPRGLEVSFGEYGLKALGRGLMSAKQIEAARRAITHATRRGGKVWVRVFPDKPITKKPAGVRMGSGKGDVVGFAVVVLPGRVLFEVAGVDEELAKAAFAKAASKLPFATKVVLRD